jgi:hypothetical protein
MAFSTWFSIADEQTVRGAFEARLPSDWIYRSSDRDRGTMRWRRDFGGPFAIEMLVSPTIAKAGGYAFQTTLVLLSDELPKLEQSANFDECMPVGFDISGPRNNDVVVSLYVEGLPKFLNQTTLWLALWSPQNGIDDPGRWLGLVDQAVARFKISSDEVQELSSTILELGALGERPSPNPVTVWRNAFIGAAEVAMLLGQRERAAEVIETGRARDWSVSGVKPLDPVFRGFASCQADKLAAMGYRWPAPA